MTTLPVRPTARVPARSTDLVSEIMGRVSSRNTEPEKVLQKALRRAGLRSFRACDTSLPGKPDIVLPSKRLAIFVDGDFWHGHQYKLRGFESLQSQLSDVNNAAYWTEKISRNIDRDFKNTAALLDSGWRVLRFWESEIRQFPDKCAEVTLKGKKRPPRGRPSPRCRTGRQWNCLQESAWSAWLCTEATGRRSSLMITIPKSWRCTARILAPRGSTREASTGCYPVDFVKQSNDRVELFQSR
jgi:DNA mismatch endonuclease, patch repair protein